MMGSRWVGRDDPHERLSLSRMSSQANCNWDEVDHSTVFHEIIFSSIPETSWFIFRSLTKRAQPFKHILEHYCLIVVCGWTKSQQTNKNSFGIIWTFIVLKIRKGIRDESYHLSIRSQRLSKNDQHCQYWQEGDGVDIENKTGHSLKTRNNVLFVVMNWLLLQELTRLTIKDHPVYFFHEA